MIACGRDEKCWWYRELNALVGVEACVCVHVCVHMCVCVHACSLLVKPKT